MPRVLLPKKQLHSVSGLNIEVSEWLADIEDKEILQKSFFLHHITKHLKYKLYSSLLLGFEEFKRYVVLRWDSDMIKTKDRAI